MSAVQVFWKHGGEKKKLLVTCNFSFSYSIFCPYGELSFIFIKFEIVVSGFSPEIFEGMVAFSGIVKLGTITNVTQSAT